MKKKDYTCIISKEKLENDLKEKSLHELSKIYNIDRRQLSRLAKEYGIIIKTSNEQHINNVNLLSKNILIDEYINNKMSTTKIAQKYHIARRTVDLLINQYNIKRTHEETIAIRSSSLKLALINTSDRTQKQVNICSTKDSLYNFIISLDEKDRTLKRLSELLNYNIKHIGKLIRKFNLENFISYKDHSSYYEDEVTGLIQSWGIINIERNTKKYLDGQEIDIYLPDYKIGIEFNGNYWHCDIYKDDHNGRSLYHQKKSLLAESKGIFLFHIFEYEWNDSIMKRKIIARLKTLLNLNTKIYARNCEIKLVDSEDKKYFLNEYHLQGNDKSSTNIGLYYMGKLVAIMTFCLARFSKQYKYELSRFCTKDNITIIGGANKLFHYYVKNYMKNNDTIVTYNDITKTRGNLYVKLGFTFQHISDPNYIWWNPVSKEILTRYQSRMKNENSIMHDSGYCRIADCGNKVWKYIKI